MKKILALVLALVLSLSLASVAFAAVIDGGNMTDDSDNPYHTPTVNVPAVTYGDTLTFWACFDDADWQVGSAEIANGLVAKDGSQLLVPWNAKWDFVITEGVEYVADFALQINDGKEYVEADEAYAVVKVDLAIKAKDPVISVNKNVKGYLYAYDANAQDTEYVFACDFVIELRNHYIDVQTDAKLAQNNASFNNVYTRNDLKNAIATKAGILYLEKHFGGDNSSQEPAYVITTAQFDTLPAYTAAAVAYKDLVVVSFADAAIQDGINFKYEAGFSTVTKADLYKNPDAKPVYTFKFLSAETVESTTVVDFLNEKAIVAGIGADVVYVYVNGEYYTTMDAKTDIAFELEAGATLGEYVFTAEAPAAKGDKENVGTGASDMTSVCVALAVVSLVAAGAVCVKKVSK